ncbi:hypothetical protein GR702_01420 [Novosphingobium sp. FGD1]|uniref:Uncharacterized protein n=1 Tax=Novosphingobium silvae TaxID=2692619 RepID=A0A7X4GF72_9SPHN|nr:hypothetical protein [Novosphingobium silvae]MYL96434.1 hypothetical protein [Novosphingobium silvae]
MRALLALLGLGRKLIVAVIGFVWAHPWVFATLAWCAVAALQWSGKEKVRAERNEVRAALSAEQMGRKADSEAWRRQVTTARAAVAAAKRKSQEIASNAQTTHDALETDNAGLRNYIASRRLRAGSGSAVSTSPADDLGAGVPSPAAPEAVMADETDLRTCDGNFAYALAAHEWALSLISAGLAVPAE